MRFQTNVFLWFAIPAFAIFIVGWTNPPLFNDEKSFSIGLELKKKLEVIKLDLDLLTAKEGVNTKASAGKIDNALADLKLIIDEGRKRFYRQPIWICNIAALALLLVGLIVTLLISWKADIQRLSTDR